nr:MAG TPA: hypothetical protein [Caudoviricetes sp.]DAV24041.1 MAG TPA: hypothetical protein [Bacteriophage sp.]
MLWMQKLIRIIKVVLLEMWLRWLVLTRLINQ